MGESDMGVGLCLNHLGNLYKKQYKYNQAKTEYQKAYDLMNQISDRWHWLEACISLAEIHLLTDNIPDFDHYIWLAEKTATEINSPEHLATIYLLKHDYNLRQGNYSTALANYKQSKTMQDSILGIQKNNRYMDLRVNYERDQNTRRLEQIEAQNNARQAEKQLTIYISWAVLFVGIIISALLYYGYRQRTRSNKILQQVEQARSDFFTNITHEFRTPLTVIQGLNQQMQEKKSLSEKEKTAFMAAIDRQSGNLLNLVNQLLNIAKLKSGTDIPQWQHGDIVAYLRMIAESFRLYAEEKGINLIFYSESTSLEMDFVPGYMDEIIGNLLSNAIKHTEAGDKINFIIAKKNHPENLIIT